MRERITKGAILESKYTYGWETTLYDFYEVMNVSPKGMATLRQLEEIHKYYPGPDGKVYYDTPESVTPAIGRPMIAKQWKNDERFEGEVIIKRKIHNFGTDKEYVKPNAYHTATLWDGTAKAVHNWH